MSVRIPDGFVIKEMIRAIAKKQVKQYKKLENGTRRDTYKANLRELRKIWSIANDATKNDIISKHLNYKDY